ncbi:MAG: BON domain-containing protein [Novosphingobium sp.]|nr:MAG: BON domain-containing protein [Novosphingobium sp.]
MTDYRDRYRSHDDDRSEDPGQRWRRNEERYRREASGTSSGTPNENRFDDDRYEANRRSRDFGYGRTFRDDEAGGRGGLGRNDWRDQRTYNQRGFDEARDDKPVHHWHEQDRELRSGQPYQGTYGGTGDSSYFTGQQGSWGVGGPQNSHNYYGGTGYGGSGGYGADYRQHGYGSRDDGRRGFWDRASDEVASWFGDEDAARRRDEDHRGHGPKDYTRSDERIREDANDRLTEDWRVDASNVTVTVEKGEITLNGTVASREAKRRAEDVVDNVSGVKHVQNNLRVAQVTPGTGWSSDAGLATEGKALGQVGTGAKDRDKI